VLDRLSIYLPIIIMGVFALGTWWLVRSTPGPLEAEVVRPVRHEPDYFMRQFALKTFDASGRLKSEITGVEAHHYPDTDLLEIQQVRMRSFNEAGQLTVATANLALSKGDGSEVQLLGNAHVVREAGTTVGGSAVPRLEFRGEFLHAFVETERLKSHLPVVLVRGADQFTADALDYDNLSRVIDLRGRVHGVLAPRPAR
jgi:lipopolysaccharide export system protein LptC